MKKFEYLTITIPTATGSIGYKDKLNEYGNEGWELVSAFPYEHRLILNSPEQGYIFIFKREI